MDDKELEIIKLKADLFDLQAKALSIQSEMASKSNELKLLLKERSMGASIESQSSGS